MTDIHLDDSIYIEEYVIPPNYILNYQTLFVNGTRNQKRAIGEMQFDPYYEITLEDREELRKLVIAALKEDEGTA